MTIAANVERLSKPLSSFQQTWAPGWKGQRSWRNKGVHPFRVTPAQEPACRPRRDTGIGRTRMGLAMQRSRLIPSFLPARFRPLSSSMGPSGPFCSSRPCPSRCANPSMEVAQRAGGCPHRTIPARGSGLLRGLLRRADDPEVLCPVRPTLGRRRIHASGRNVVRHGHRHQLTRCRAAAMSLALRPVRRSVGPRLRCLWVPRWAQRAGRSTA